MEDFSDYAYPGRTVHDYEGSGAAVVAGLWMQNGPFPVEPGSIEQRYEDGFVY